MVFERLDGAHSDFVVLREGGARRSHCDILLVQCKFHVRELTAFASDNQVFLTWHPADEALADPFHDDHFGTASTYFLERNGEIATMIDHTLTSYVDPIVSIGTYCEYWCFYHHVFVGNEL